MHRLLRFVVLSVMLTALSLTASAAATPAGSISRVEQGLLQAQVIKGAPVRKSSLADEMRRLKVPGVSVAVIHNGKIAWAKGYGVTVVGGPPVTPATLFQAASISKPVSAMAALQMAQAGLLDLDRPAGSYLTSWTFPDDPASQAVTVRALLSHTAGISVSGFPGYGPGQAVPSVAQVLDGLAPATTAPVRVTSPPGQAWRYSGGGYTVLQQLMSDVAGKPFDVLIAERVLRPLGMNDSHFEQPASARTLRGAAMPHDGAGKPYAGGPFSYPELAAAGMWSTPTDLAKFALSIQAASQPRKGAVFNAAMALAMLTPVKNGYGLGLEIAGEAGSRTFAHGGSNKGYQNSMVAYAGRGDGAVVMTNGEGGADLARALIRAVAAEYNWPTYRTQERSAVNLPSAALKAAVGTYAIKGLGEFDITEQAGGLTFWIKAGQGERLYAQSPTVFFVLSRQLELRFDQAGGDEGRLVAGPVDVRFKRSAK